MMADTNAVLRLAPKLADAVQSEDWHAAAILAADLKAAQAEPQKFTPWTPYCQRNAS